MKTLSLWSGLQTLWQPRAAAPAGPADERVVTEALRVHRTLGEMARLQSPLALQAADGGFIGGGVLTIESPEVLQLHLRAGTALRGGETAWPVNATAAGVRGLVLFTLLTRATGTPRRLLAPWPDQLILIQSRRHFRLTGLAGARRRAWLSRPEAPGRVPVHDLSEEGLGIEVTGGHWPDGGSAGRALLHLDDEVIPVPLVETVHARPALKDAATIIGARMLGLGEDQRRLLRRWITTMQATQAGCADQGV